MYVPSPPPSQAYHLRPVVIVPRYPLATPSPPPQHLLEHLAPSISVKGEVYPTCTIGKVYVAGRTANADSQRPLDLAGTRQRDLACRGSIGRESHTRRPHHQRRLHCLHKPILLDGAGYRSGYRLGGRCYA